MDDRTRYQSDPHNVIARVDKDSTQAEFQALPKAEISTVSVVQIPGTTVDGLEGLVTYERRQHKHHKTTFSSWRMTGAVLVDWLDSCKQPTGVAVLAPQWPEASFVSFSESFASMTSSGNLVT